MLPKFKACLNVLVFASSTIIIAEPVKALDDNSRIYGYFAWRTEKVWDELSITGDGSTETNDAPREISLPSFNIMYQSQVDKNVKVFFNLNGGGADDVSVNNVWGEYKFSNALNLRLGKTYRRFGLYNEILDAVPTYIGIEAPELFDKDHLILSRETLAMLHGYISLGGGDLRYSFSVDNGEGGPTEEDNIPLGLDLRYEWGLGNYTVGTSMYTSNGDTTSDVSVGEGSPRTGVLPWMSADDFTVAGAYTELNFSGFTVQAAYWNASHDATRDPTDVVNIVNNAGINDAQRARFLIDPDAAVTEDNVRLNGDYDIDTWYIRSAYSFYTEKGSEISPYIQWDEYENPETIQSKTYGGDAEAGLADDGKFAKATIGVIYRPIPQLAVKLDGSTHFQEFNGSSESYPEIRLDVSYIFGQ